MAENLSNTIIDDSSYLKESESEQTFVGKVRSIITNTPLSKWFKKDNRPVVRRRDEDFDDESQEMQPPAKRVKLPDDSAKNNFSVYSETVTHNQVKKHTKICDYFPEPVAGPSGINTSRLANGISVNSVHNRLANSETVLNDRKDSDSEESTSGYSSVAKIGSKEQVYQSPSSSKQTSPSQNVVSTNARSLFQMTPKPTATQDLFVDRRSTSTHVNTCLSSRRPSFNASTFGSPNFVDRTLLTKKIINSPFYNGKTIYGGASAYGHNLGRTQKDLRTQLKSSIQIKPINKNTENGNVVLGKTARRILETLEQYSSPVNDAKKIPIVSKKCRSDGVLTKYVGANPYLKKASTKELHVPSVSDLLKMKQKTRLQDSTEAVRQIATTSRSNLNSESYKLGGEGEKDKHTSKMRTKVTSIRQKTVIKERIPEVNLNPISLPITNLPKFDIVIPPPVSSEHVKSPPKLKVPSNKDVTPSEKTHIFVVPQKNDILDKEQMVPTQKSVSDFAEFTFSNPLVIAENLKSIAAINNFKFSEPVCKRSKKTESTNASLNFKMPENKMPTLKPKTKSTKPEPVLKTGSVMDILGKKDSLTNKFKPPSNTWECSACMVRNPLEKSNCIACETPNSKIQTKDTKGFGSQFKKSADKWECPICMVQNANSDLKCIACTAAKPLASTMTNDLSKKQSDFGSKFKLPSDMWECPICMVRNKIELAKCAACESPAPKTNIAPSDSFSNKFKPASSTWECSTCLVRNKDEVTKCIACETSRSNMKATSGDNFGASFKIKSNEWECGVCMVRNKAENSKCQCCEATKPGSIEKSDATKDKPISSFNFGIDKASATSFNFGISATATVDAPKLDVKPSSVFGESAKNTTVINGGFTFGVPAHSKEKPLETKKIATVIQPKSNPLLKPTEKLPEAAKPAATGFQFGPVTKSTIVPTAQQNETIPKSLTSAVDTAKLKPITIMSATKSVTDVSVNANKVDTSLGTKVPTTLSQPTNLFSFGVKPSSPVSQDINNLKTDSSQSVSSTSLFKFGGPSKPVANTVAPVFGSSIVSSSNNESPFKVAGPANTTEVKPFSFGSSTAKTEEPPKPGASGFTFSASNNAPIFNFAVAKTENSTNIFGGVAPADKIFNFGSTTSNSQKAAGFNFGSALAPAPGKFNFSVPPPSFDVNTKPTFNFSAGASTVPTFTAQPLPEGGEIHPPRKMKKAIRRTQR